MLLYACLPSLCWLWLTRTQRTMKFINTDASSIHGNLRVGSVYTSESGEWKLGGFEVLSSVTGALLHWAGTAVLTHHEGRRAAMATPGPLTALAHPRGRSATTGETGRPTLTTESRGSTAASATRWSTGTRETARRALRLSTR